jgi:hypothetical protein
MLDFEKFKNCPSEYRSAPFWSLNDELEEEELVRQIRLMHEQGIGGFFMHPRGGMKDEYMSEKYIKAIRACVEEAERLGMKAWLYDEDRFPSGGAGGLVMEGHPEFAQKALFIEEVNCNEVKKTAGTLKIYKTGEDGYKDITSLEEQDIHCLPDKALVFRSDSMPNKEIWNNHAYTDLCSKEAVERFIEVTHEKYKSEFGEYFGNVIPGIFADEPNFNTGIWGKKANTLPWTAGFEQEFLRRKGYDLLEQLPKLYVELEDYQKVRFDFWDVISRLFVEGFSQTIYNWCEANDMKFTGHYWEHGFPFPNETGSTMPNYEFMQYPGIDMLFNTEKYGDQVGNDLIVKEVSSVANQLGKERVLSETYGASGWELNFEDQKRIADWQFALGINLVCQHLVHYSLKGFRKRDFPLSFLDHQPWWECYHLLGDYIGRLSYIMSQGEFVGDILVLHPYSSAWAEYRVGGENPELGEIKESFRWITRTLSELQYFFDLGDDVLMERYGRVEGDRLIIGRMSYRTIILPHMPLMRGSSFALLKEFAANGGRILLTGNAPYRLDGVESEELKTFFNKLHMQQTGQNKELLANVLQGAGNLHAVITDEAGGQLPDIYCHKRKLETAELYFLCNFSRTEGGKTSFMLEQPGQVEEWDAVTGEKKALCVIEKNGKFHIELDFPPAGSHLLLVDMGRPFQAAKACEAEDKPAAVVVLEDWKVQRLNANNLTLKQCQYRLEGGVWSDWEDVLKVDGTIAEKLGMEYRSIFTRQPWMYNEQQRSIKAQVELRYRFTIAQMPEGELYAAIEAPEEFTVFVNGKRVENTGKSHWDRAFVLHDIKAAVVQGENEVLLKTDCFRINSSVECIYIAGDFKVEKENGVFFLKREDEQPAPGDWTKQGYPYYSGTMKYTTVFEYEKDSEKKAVLKLDEVRMVAARIYVNGKAAGILGWKPYSAELAGLLSDGRNEISIVVMNSLQNMLGSHNSYETPGFATPGSFYFDGEDTRFVASGFNGKAVVEIG